MFQSVIVANRGEIAVRVLRTLRRLGIRGIATYSDADRDALHARVADDAVRLGPGLPRESYLHVERVIEAALRAGADALHPGYGFLAESAALARACADAGIVFIGPGPDAIAAMGDKIRARDTVAAAGVPIVPGSSGAGLSDDEIAEAAVEIGVPVLLKPSAGGGGKGMRLVTDVTDLPREIRASRREAAAAFGDDTLLIERFVERPRHIEIQIAADQHGNVVHIGERECSLQRRHQKIVEEAPSPFVTPALRDAMGAQAVAVARACGYTNVGTVELIVSGAAPDDFFFMEMNTRLQVEHPVTEEAYGLDLVELQLRIAAGEPLPFAQMDLQPRCHAIEARIYAEDPDHGFLPTGGTVVSLREPMGPGIRVDSGLSVGTEVGTTYDPMLAKVVARADTRDEALLRLHQALGGTSILGLTTNVPFLRNLLVHDSVRRGDLDTGLVERMEASPVDVPDYVAVAALFVLLVRPVPASTWDRRDGWRLGDPAWIEAHLEIAGQPKLVRLQQRAGVWRATIGDSQPVTVDVEVDATTVRVEHRDARVLLDRTDVIDGTLWLGHSGRSWAVAPIIDQRGHRSASAVAGGEVASPMPGTVVSINVGVGEVVIVGQSVAVVEAMKMEHTLVSPLDGTVTTIHVGAGSQVLLRQVIVTVAPHQEGAP